MKRGGNILKRIICLAGLIWCMGACPLSAQNTDPKTEGDTIPQEVRRDRKTATGHRRKGRITEVPDSVALKQAKSEATDSLKTDSLKPAVKKTLTDSIKTDTAGLVIIADSLIKKAFSPPPPPHFRPDPIRSMWLALVFPGGGQIYNRKYWKLPIFYGGFLGCTYALTWNNQMLRDYQQAYLDIMDSDPNTQSYMKMLPMGYDITGKEERFKNIFKNKKNHFRRYRDLSIFSFAGVYLLSVIDAYVDAELSSFDVNEDLSFRLEPAIIEQDIPGQRRGTVSYGIGCRLLF